MPDTTVPMDYADAIKKAADATAQLKTQWDSPAFRQQSRQLAVARVEYERTVTALQRINQQETIRARTMDMQRRMGKFGAAVVGAGMAIGSNAVVQGAWGLAQRASHYGHGMAQRGFGGTAESMQMGTQMTLLAREFAGVAKPFTDGITKITKSMRKVMESMDSDQQNRLLYGGMGVIGGAIALRYRATIGAGISGAAGLAGLTGGGGMGATALKFVKRAPLIGGAVSLGQTAFGYGETHANKTSPYTKTFAEENPQMSRYLDTLTKEQMREYWQKTKDSGSPSLGHQAINTTSRWIRNQAAWIANQIPIGERIKYIDEYSNYDQLKREITRRGAISPKDSHRNVTLPGGGIEEAGSGYFRMQAAFGAQQLANNQGGDETLGFLDRIAKAVESMAKTDEVK